MLEILHTCYINVEFKLARQKDQFIFISTVITWSKFYSLWKFLFDTSSTVQFLGTPNLFLI